jgi:hypothetical protein
LQKLYANIAHVTGDVTQCEERNMIAGTEFVVPVRGDIFTQNNTFS